jgi:hypothetical protein
VAHLFHPFAFQYKFLHQLVHMLVRIIFQKEQPLVGPFWELDDVDQLHFFPRIKG